ncbi:hypothetical protein DFH29DRAFT_1000553 [Suillus ampliporus]|nr:hypothetical protein DFH29DRAFT_1000553 [Suillus ampliporus]
MSEHTSSIGALSVPLRISSIVIRLDDTSKRKVEFAELKLDSQRQEIHRASDKDKDLSAKFDPPM